MPEDNKEQGPVDGIRKPESSWLRKRKITSYIFLVESFFLGMEYSVFFLTVWLYIKTLVKPSNPKLIYSLTSTAYLISSILLSIIVGKIADKTRLIKKLFIVSNILVVIGNMLYTFHFSVYYLIFGRLISGAAGPLRSVISGELARAYPPNELSTYISWNGMCFASGFVFGPAISFAFLPVDFKIQDWHITVANAAGVFMAIVFVVLTILSYFFVHDLSKEFDLKHEREKMDEFKKSEDNESYKIHNESIDEKTLLITTTKSLKTVYLRIEVLLLILCSFYFLFIITYYDMSVPIIIVDTLKQSVKEINAIIFSSNIIAIPISLVFIKKELSDKGLYYVFIMAIILGFGSIISFCLSKINGETNLANIFLWIFFVLCFGPLCVTQEIFLVTTFAKIMPSSQQIFGESIRVGFERFGSMMALIFSAYLYDVNAYFSIFLVLILLSLLLIAIMKRHSLQNPKAIAIS